MGCSSPQNATMPNIPAHHLKRLNEVSQITHPLNINKKYELFIRLQQTKFSGNGFRRTNSYHCLTTPEELKDKIKEFWETRTSGQAQTWEILRKALSIQNDSQAMALLNQNRIHLLNGSIQMCIDSKFNKYEIPVYCINLPLSVGATKISDRNLSIEFQEKQVEVVVRSAKYPNGDMHFNDSTSARIEKIKESIRALKELDSSIGIRLFYQGRQMKDENYLGSYGYVSGLVIQAMIR